jgi:hypothetical protein
MAANGKRRPPRPQIEILGSTASESEAAAVVAAVEQFLADTAPPPSAETRTVSRWQQAALAEGVSARQIHPARAPVSG